MTTIRELRAGRTPTAGRGGGAVRLRADRCRRLGALTGGGGEGDTLVTSEFQTWLIALAAVIACTAVACLWFWKGTSTRLGVGVGIGLAAVACLAGLLLDVLSSAS